MTKITFIEADGTEKVIDAENGLSLLEVAHNNGVALEGACKVLLLVLLVISLWRKNFLINYLTLRRRGRYVGFSLGLTHTSRLGCQIIIDIIDETGT